MLNPKEGIQACFSKPRADSFEITGHATRKYNCIAWAAEDTSQWWWPEPSGYWPDGVAEELTLAAFVQAFGALGYVPCDSPILERRSVRVASYVKNGVPTHAARQLPNGRWTSKLGPSERIEHDFDALEGNGLHEYGQITQIMSRQRRTSLSLFAARLMRLVKP